MKRKIGKINTDLLFEAIAEICREYNEKHKKDPIVGFSGHFKLAEKTTEIKYKKRKT
jgi:hypothetical protein